MQSCTRYILFSRNSFSTMAVRGAFIVLEGCDKSGKSSQAAQLTKSLQQKAITCDDIRFPDRTTVTGKMLDAYLRNQREAEDHVIHLMFSANRWELAKRIEMLLNEGTTLVVDRYAYSGVAFSAVKRGLSLEWCMQSDVGLPEPDAVLFLDIAPEKAAKRSEYGNERYECVSFQTAVYENYMKLRTPYWHMINADRDFDSVQADLVARSLETIAKVGKLPINRLWTTKNETN